MKPITTRTLALTDALPGALTRAFTRTLFSALALAVLSGCASPMYYQAAGTNGRHTGYADRQVDGALHRVNFVANPGTPLDQAYAYAMYRAAELAQSKGAPYFEVLEGPINKDAIERFINKPTASNARAFDGDDLSAINASVPLSASPSALPHPPRLSFAPLPAPIPAETVRYAQAQTYIYVPIQPPPPPVQVSLLIRLLSAPSLDAARGFDVNDLLTRLTPKIVRPPVKTA